jgi:hypothetical protein
MTDPDANQKLTRGIFALIACVIVSFLGFVFALWMSIVRSPLAPGFWIATAASVAPVILTMLASMH